MDKSFFAWAKSFVIGIAIAVGIGATGNAIIDHAKGSLIQCEARKN